MHAGAERALQTSGIRVWGRVRETGFSITGLCPFPEGDLRTHPDVDGGYLSLSIRAEAVSSVSSRRKAGKGAVEQ